MENKLDWEPKIYLSKVIISDLEESQKNEEIANFPITENGFFAFKKKLFLNKEAIYQLRVSHRNKSDIAKRLFILSNKDSITFRNSKKLLSSYITTNEADKEWQKLRSFEAKLLGISFNTEDSISNAYVNTMKTYAKDSLKILRVKLISIKQLDNKALLEKDIAKNRDYYVVLLKELKESNIDRTEYLFLENKLAFLTTEVAENKYATSKIIIALLGILVAGLLFFVFRLRNKGNEIVLSDLSKQENNIQSLILQGKSNKEIANELFISLSTVKTHITNIYGKLQVSNRRELVQKAQNS